MFNTIANYLPDIEMTGAPTRMRHGWINGITVMPVRFNAR
jgi:cholest-4-en-3-one 26-monooxygenase